MRIVGEWHLGVDGMYRPTVKARLATGHGSFTVERFLVDTGADRTVLCASLLASLGLPLQQPAPGSALAGVGELQGFVLVNTNLELVADDNTVAHFRGDLAAFTDPAALVESILGLDVLNHFQLIVSRPTDEVLLPATNHRYRVEPP
jgi:hypothetical protein